MRIAQIVSSSEDSLQIQFRQEICPEVNHKISNFVEELNIQLKDFPAITEIVPAYCSVTVYYKSKDCDLSFLKSTVEKILNKTLLIEETDSFPEKIIEIPVCYEDEQFAPDMNNVMKHTNMTKEQVINLHSSTDYLIYMMGFLPGFPYLGGMDEKLETPRLETPRTKIPAGSVAIGGKQTGLYPIESPGGWQIIGRTPIKVFDLHRTPSFLYKAGDKIRFVPINRQEFYDFDESEWFKKNITVSDHKSADKNTYACGSGIKILDSGLSTTVQDYGITGFQKYGIGQSGVMDEISFNLANILCGNPENTACLETTLNGPEIQFVLPCDFAITGASFENATLDNIPILMNKKYHAEKGSILKCGFASKGLRSYIAFSGGVLVPTVFGSRSTNLKSRIGGYEGRKLSAGDELAVGYIKMVTNFQRQLQYKTNPFFSSNDDVLLLETTKSSQFDFFDNKIIKNFEQNIYTVSPESDRMGIRFTGPKLDCGKTDIISDAVPFGSVQITSSGLPVVMAADRQTTGGYAKIVCVTKESMCKLAQAVPGTKVRFKIQHQN